MSSLIELDRERLQELLAELDRRLAARGVAAGVYVVGGAAIALTVAVRRVTMDVDRSLRRMNRSARIRRSAFACRGS